MVFLLFLAHFPEAPQSERLHSGRDPKELKGGTGKAEDAKLPGAGISLKQCPGKGAAEKGYVADSVTIARVSEQGGLLKMEKAQKVNAIG
jgi:hypothetical protein